MKITIEQVEKLMERANVSHEEAKSALEAADGDILDALIALEKEGKTENRSGSYSTSGTVPVYAGPQANGGYSNGNNFGNNENGNGSGFSSEKGYHSEKTYDSSYKKETSGIGEQLNKFWQFCLRLLRKSFENHFEVYRYGVRIIYFPVILMVILLVCFLPFSIAALIVGLFFSCHYRFRGPDLGKDGINNVMDAATDTAESFKQSVKDAANNTNK